MHSRVASSFIKKLFHISQNNKQNGLYEYGTVYQTSGMVLISVIILKLRLSGLGHEFKGRTTQQDVVETC